MRILIAAAAITLLAAHAQADTMKNCGAAWRTMSADAKAKTYYTTYSKMCLASDYKVPAPGQVVAAPAAPAGAIGRCKDGSFTMSKSHTGACSSHGGVTEWLDTEK